MLAPGLTRAYWLVESLGKELAVLFGEPETARFLAVLLRLKRQRRHRERQTRLAKQRVREVLRKMRDC